jgi:hypothetical protein
MTGVKRKEGRKETWKKDRVGEKKRSEGGRVFLGSKASKRVFGGLREERRMGLGRWGSNLLRGTWLTSRAPLACITLIEWRTSADAVIVEMMRKKTARKERNRTDATLAVTLIYAEHRNVSPEVTFTMRRLFADYHSDGMGYTLSICLLGG